jgi:Dyp-type peroxidase family
MAAADLNGALERADIQGLLASGYGHLRRARYLLLAIDDAARARAWLARVADEVTTSQARSDGTGVNLAIAPSGLSRLGLPPALAGFSDRFLDGMTAPHRSRALGDVGIDAPGHWDWGGPDNPRIDVLLLLYAAGASKLDLLERRLAGAPAMDGLTLVRSLETRWSDREHFGFRDGIAQPFADGLRDGAPDDRIAPGEFVLGHPNQYGDLTRRPLIDRTADAAGVLPVDDITGKADLGRNGSYLVLRTLSQDVAGFWAFVDRASRADNGHGDPAAARIRLAAQIVGRWPDGEPLALAPDSPGQTSGPVDAFRYFDIDPDGVRCPLGAHIRRTHPRDTLDPEPGSERSVALDKQHRLLRRGRTYGEPVAPAAALEGRADAAERGLHFICLCANIARQFEFVQHTWINNPKFNGLYEDADPLTGPAGRTFTVQAQPVRRRVAEMPSFVTVRGGAYFFLPGIRAIRYLASLPPAVG